MPELENEMYEAYITVTTGMRGIFPVMMTWNENHNGFYEPYSTGETCKDFDEAVIDAKAWAGAENIEYR